MVRLEAGHSGPGVGRGETRIQVSGAGYRRVSDDVVGLSARDGGLIPPWRGLWRGILAATLPLSTAFGWLDTLMTNFNVIRPCVVVIERKEDYVFLGRYVRKPNSLKYKYLINPVGGQSRGKKGGPQKCRDIRRYI